MENQRDNFIFYDNDVDALNAAGLRILGLLCGGSPAWASVKPRHPNGFYNLPDAPDGKERWTNYITKMVEHYRGKIDEWEVWNEAWSGYFMDLPKEERGTYYGELLKLAWAAAKKVNPQAGIVGMVTALEYDQFTEDALKVTGVEFMDYFSYHDYSGKLYGGDGNRATLQAKHFAAIQEPHGEPRPLWCTESSADKIASFYGWEEGAGLAPRRQCMQVVRADVSMIAAGVQRGFYYTLQPDAPSESVGWVALEHDRAIRPVMAARAVLASLVDGAGCSRSDMGRV